MSKAAFIVSAEGIPEDTTPSLSLPTLTAQQDAHLASIADLTERAEALIGYLGPVGKVRHGEPSVELERELKSLEEEERVQGLYWHMMGRCESHGSSLFSRLCSHNLLTFLRGHPIPARS